MRILLLGASGRSGRWVSRLARDRGHDVTAVLREGTTCSPENGLHVVRGDVLDPAFLGTVVPGHDVVLSCLGIRRRNPLPWSRLLSPPDLVQRAMAALVAGVRTADTDPSVIWISAAGVGASRRETAFPIRMVIGLGNLGLAYQDLEKAEDVMASSGVDHLTIRPVTLVDGPPGDPVGPVRRYGIRSAIRRSDLAGWMLDVAEERERYAGLTVMLARIS